MKRIGSALIALIAALGLLAALVGCGSSAQSTATSETGSTAAPASESAPAGPTRVASLKGPTSIGIAAFIQEATDNGEPYEFAISGAADEIVPQLIQGNVDIALVPANVASVVYNKTQGGVKVIDINTLGVLSVVTADSGIQSFADLAGKTVYMTGKGATPEYVMNFLLDKEGIADQVTLEFKSEATEVAAQLASDPAAIGVLPEPYVTAICTQNPDLSPVVSLTDAWDVAVGDSGSRLVTGVTVVRAEFLEAHPEVVAEFLDRQSAASDLANAAPETVAPIVADLGIVDNAAIAEAAIPRCNLVCIQGEVMKVALGSYLEALYAADPSSVGGTLPGEDFYYLGE